jgi:prevent-host-death family protein
MREIDKGTTMPKTISVSEAKNRLSEMLDWASENLEGVVVESRGKPKAVILPYAEYEKYLSMREREQRRAALQRMDELAAAVRAQNQDISPAEVEQIADEISRETIERMVEEGNVAFKQP